MILVTGAMDFFGTAGLAGYGIGSGLDYLFVPVLFGLGTSALNIVGACVGAGDMARAKQIAAAATILAAVGSEFVGTLIAFFRYSGSAYSAGIRAYLCWQAPIRAPWRHYTARWPRP